MEEPERLNRRMMLLAGGALAALPVIAPFVAPIARAQVPVAAAPEDQTQVASLPFNLKGRFVQSGYCVGQAAPRAELWVDGTLRGLTSAVGYFYVGFDRDCSATCLLVLKTPSGAQSATLNIAAMTYDVQRVDGLPQDTVTPTDPVLLERIKQDSALKAQAFASRADGDGFHDGFAYPLDSFRVSGHFGNQRVLNGTPKSPHMGFDMAAPVGTPVHAPQKGLVVLAEQDLFYEGGLVLIDHGQGLISMYLHQSEVIARKGDTVAKGQLIGKVGAKGRATGPHLCWRLKWGERHMDPSLMVAKSA